jgi:hypothetical protein
MIHLIIPATCAQVESPYSLQILVEFGVVWSTGSGYSSGTRKDMFEINLSTTNRRILQLKSRQFSHILISLAMLESSTSLSSWSMEGSKKVELSRSEASVN